MRVFLLQNTQLFNQLGRIVNVSADDSVLDTNGKVDPAKLQPITYDSMHHKYLLMGEAVGQAFHDGMSLK